MVNLTLIFTIINFKYIYLPVVTFRNSILKINYIVYYVDFHNIGQKIRQ